MECPTAKKTLSLDGKADQIAAFYVKTCCRTTAVDFVQSYNTTVV